MAPSEPRTSVMAPATGLPAWDDLVGYDDMLAAWRRLVASGRMPSVLLLDGRSGLGKRALLAALAGMHVCETGVACGACRQCRWLLAGVHPEVLWLEAAETEGKAAPKLLMEDAEALQEHLSLAPDGAVKARLAVVVDADLLTSQAANRLLKTLEEPPERTRILLSTSRADLMLPTVLSRCVKWRVSPPPLATSLAWLTRRLAAAGVDTDPDVLQAWLKRSGLAPGAALALAAAGAGPELSSRWLTGASVGEALADIETLLRETAPHAGELLTEAEMLLNQAYEQAFHSPGKVARGFALPARVRRRRATLSAAKALVVRGKVPLNVQLVAESLALSDGL